MGSGIFSYCSNLANVTILEGIKAIGESMFFDCDSLTKITIPQSVTSIGGQAFARSGLTSINIHNNITNIGYSAFEDCSSLINITIPASVTSIGNKAFYMSSLYSPKNLIMESETPPAIGSTLFNGIHYVTIKVPTFEAYEAYITATNWSNYADAITTDDSGLIGIENQILLLDSNPTYSINLQYIGEPNFTVVSDNPNVCTATIDGDIVTLTGIGAGTTNVTVSMVGANSQTFSVTVYETLPEYTYSVEAIDGVTYGFALNDDNYYESTNKAIDSSFALCKLVFNSNGIQRLYLDCINSGESSYDFGILSNVDATLNADAKADSTNVFKSFKGQSNSAVQTLEYGIIEAGEHFIYIKYIKDSSNSSGNDSLQFKVRTQ